MCNLLEIGAIGGGTNGQFLKSQLLRKYIITSYLNIFWKTIEKEAHWGISADITM